MSKRGADEYITKEHGSTPNAAGEANKVTMATAAQLAKRKMAVPKSRAGRTGQSPLPGAGAPSSNPFTGPGLFGAPQADQQSGFSSAGGVSFGTSQSFPTGNTMANSGFNFSVPSQSTSFTFGQPVSNNPFANLNGNTSGMPASSQETNDITMESPQKKPAFGSNVFGSTPNENNTSSTGFSFGQSMNESSKQPSFAFGQSQNFGTSLSGPLFGQSSSKPQETSSADLFGKSTQAPGSTTTATAGFGQSSDSSQPTTQPSGFNFGQPATSAPPSSSKPLFGFGQSTAAVSSSTPAFSFGQTATKPAGESSVFSPVSSASQPTSSAPLFASSQSSSNVFGGFGNSKPAEPSKSPDPNTASDQSKPSLFAQPSQSGQEQSKSSSAPQDPPKPSNPFAGLFAPQNVIPAEAPAASGKDMTKPLFNFSSPAQPSGLFATPSTNTGKVDSQENEPTPKKPAFDFGSPAQTSSANLFSTSKAGASSSASANPFAVLTPKKPESSEPKPQQPLFGFPKATPSNPDHDAKSASLFGGQSAGVPSSGSTDQVAKTSIDFGKTSTFTPAKASQSVSETPKVSTEPPKPSTGLFGSTTKTTTSSAIDVSSSKAAESQDGPKRSVNTYPPTRIPPYLNGDDYKAYDNNYRLHSLNREFQKRIGSLDPSRDDFENIVRNYVAARESIGESIGLYTRNVAGMKRKADEDDDRHGDGSSSTKRNKPGDGSPSKALFGNNQASTSVFQPVPSSTSKPAATFGNTASTSSAPGPRSSSIFSSMIPNSGSASSTAPSNPFANLSANSDAVVNNNSEKSTSFGNIAKPTGRVGSTTPTKSPPKKPAFEMPTFTAPAGSTSFMDAFRKQSEMNAVKAEKEARAKRKAEDFDSDEDDEAEWERKYDEEQKAKRAKVNAVPQSGFMPIFGNGTASNGKPASVFGGIFGASGQTPTATVGQASAGRLASKSPEKPVEISDNDTSGEGDDEDGDDSGNADENEEDDGEEDDDEEDAEDEAEVEEDDLPEDNVEAEEATDDDEDFETALARSRTKGKSLFERVTPNPSMQTAAAPTSAPSSNKVTSKAASIFGNTLGKGTPEAPSFSPLTPAGSKEPYVPAKTFTFTPTPPSNTPTPVPGASIFAGGAVKDGPIAGEGLFGSRPSTPSNADNPKANVFGGLGTPSATMGNDNTWKKGSQIKFGTSTTEAPALSITEPSPRKDESHKFGTLFGANSSSVDKTLSSNGVGFNFGSNPVPGYLSAVSHLAGGSDTNSGFSSRATSPGTTDNESVATNEEDFSNDTQVSLMETRPGEEDETVVFESKARALRWYNQDQITGTKLIKGWNGVGLGVARLLKHNETGKTRMVMRAEPGANIILNTNLQPEINYEYAPSGNAGTIKFNVFTKDGIQGWTLKVKTHQLGQEFAEAMEKYKVARS